MEETVLAIQENRFVDAHSLIEKSLYEKATLFLEEKKKQLIAQVWGKKSNLTEEDSKSIFKKSQRKAFREKMEKLNKVKG